jgi:hypothetical protein
VTFVTRSCFFSAKEDRAQPTLGAEGGYNGEEEESEESQEVKINSRI